MTPEEQEKRAAELNAEGKTEREIADELGISPATAHRRLVSAQAKQETTEDQLPPEPPELQGDDVAELSVLRDLREVQAEEVRTYEERAGVSRSAVTQLELERREALRAGHDAGQFRARMANAKADADDATEQAGYARERLAATEARIGEITAKQDLAALRAELDAAVVDWGAVCARSGDRQRAAVTAVRAAAEEFCAVYADEQAAANRVAAIAAAVTGRAMQAGEPTAAVQPPQSTALSGQPGIMAGPALALTRAIGAARAGNLQVVAAELGNANGYLPASGPTKEETERWRQMTADREKQLAGLKAPNAGPDAVDENTGPVPVALNHFGWPVDKFGNVLVPRGSAPHPMDIWRAPNWGGEYGPGYRTSQ